MLIPPNLLVEKYNIKFTGVLHVGAHECEEMEFYDKFLPHNKILWVEALPDKVEFCKNRYSDVLIENAVISDTVETVTFHRASNDQSSSILEMGTHLDIHPSISFVDELVCQTTRLDSFLCNYDISYNFVTLDIQGVELRALKSMESYLNTVDYIYTEVNSDYVYKGCGLVTEMDSYLATFGFVRVQTKWYATWGDAFYVRQTLLDPLMPIGITEGPEV